MNKYTDRIGETNIHKKTGQKMTIIAYRRCDDIDIQFEDGTIIKHKRYERFIRGLIFNPNITINKRIGETVIATNGQKMTIIAYREANDIDIQFEDGTIVEHKSYRAFNKGYIKHPTLIQNQRIGEIYTASNGQKMTIIDYNNSNDVSVRFDDGTIIKHLKYNNIIIGNVKNINFIKNLRIGQSQKANNGQIMTIIAYRGCNDLDVQFEDGIIANHISYSSFCNGQVANLNIQTVGNAAAFRIGKTNKNQNGMNITIINYRKTNDIDVQFEDGYIAEHTRYSYFIKGIVPYPGFSLRVYKDKNERIGKINTANNGMKMTIIDYRKSNDIDVKFTDGTIVNTSYAEFKLGNVRNPNITKTAATYITERLNETCISNQGIFMQIIKYNNKRNLTVKFETDYEMQISDYSQFHTGGLRHPFPYQMNNILIKKFAYVNNNIGNFYCTCIKCNYKDIWTIEEAKNHICKE